MSSFDLNEGPEEKFSALSRVYGNERSVFSSPSSPKLENIDADLHVHSQLSDGIELFALTNTADYLGLSTVSLADHVRQRWDDIDFYNRDAYQISISKDEPEDWIISEDWILSENMDVLEDLVSDWGREVNRTSLDELELVEDFLKRFGQYERQLASSGAQKILEDSKGFNLGYSFEQDYESWNEHTIEKFLTEQRPSYVPLSVHYIPLEEWDKAKYFRLDEFDELPDDALARATENYFDEYERKIEFGEYVENELGIPVIHTHADGLLRNENLRSHVQQEDFHKLLDHAEKKDATVEINGRVLRKLVETSENSGEYGREDAEWFAREVAQRAEQGDLKFIVSSDGHSSEGMIKNLLTADRLLDDYEIHSPSYEEFLEQSFENSSWEIELALND